MYVEKYNNSGIITSEKLNGKKILILNTLITGTGVNLIIQKKNSNIEITNSELSGINMSISLRKISIGEIQYIF